MKKFLATTLVAMMAMASGFAQTAKHTAAQHEATATNSIVNKSAVQRAATGIKVTPAIVVTGTATPGFLPVFTDALGDVGNSKFFQSASGNVGIGTTTPTFNLQVVSETDPAAIVVEGYGTVGVNFIGRRAEGTLAAPTALLAGDNIFAMQGRGYGTTGFSAASRAFMKFFAAENWTDAAQGTYISFATTQIGTSTGGNPPPEKMRLTDLGYLGILTTTPTSPLTVNGAIQSLAGGFVFPNGQTQLVPAVTSSLPISDGSILVGGTGPNPSLAVNTALIQARVSGTCAAGSAMTGVTGVGGVSCGTVGAGGTLANVPVVETLAASTLTGASGVSAATTIFTADATGFYRVSIYMNSPLPLGTCSGSCTGEEIVLTWSDGISAAAQATTNCSLAGPCSSSFSAPIWVASGQNIQAYSQTTGSGTAVPTGTFAAQFLVEKL